MATSYEFLPFSNFAGTVQATNVDAIELFVDSTTVGSNDVEISVIGANGPKMVNFRNASEIDLVIEKTDNQTTATPGESVTYIVTVTNNGPIDVAGATVSDLFPSDLTNITYSSVSTGTVTGNTTDGTGDITDTVNMTSGSTITYTINATISPDATGTITNTASVTAPDGVTDSNPENNSATDVDTLQPATNLSVTKTDNVTTVTPGQDLTYSIIVANNGPSDVAGATVVDNPPSSLQDVTYTSVPTGTVSGNTASGTDAINDTVDLTAGSSIEYSLTGTVVSSATGQIVNTAQVSAPNGIIETNTEDNSATDVDTVDVSFDLAISKTDNVTNVSPNDAIVYSIVVTNNGPSDVVGATVSDTFPSDLTNVSYSSTTTGVVSGNTASGTGNINDTVDLQVGATITYIVNATVLSTASGTIENTATVTAPAGSTDTNTSNNSATDTDAVDAVFDLSITKSDGVSTVVAGQATTYTITVANSGPTNVTGATVVDTFPTSLTNVSYSSTANGGATGNTESASGNISDTVNLPAGSSIQYVVTATVVDSATGTVSNTATVTAPVGMPEANTANNSATDIDTISPQVDLTISKTDNRTTVTPGETTTYTIVVSNQGPSVANGVAVNDTFPSELSNVTYSSVASGGASGNTASGGGAINDTVNLPVGSSITYTVTGTVDSALPGATVTNTATVTAPAGVTETNINNNSATDIDTISVSLRSISGFVFVDLNRNGIRDAGEPPISGVSLSLIGTDNFNNPVARSVLTNAAGRYDFDDLLPGVYTVRESQPPGFIDGSESIGTGQTSGPEVTDDVFANLGLGSEADATNFNFAEIRPQLSKRDLLASSFGG